MASDLKALLKRVEAATGADRELDIALWRMFIRPEVPANKAPLSWDYSFTESVDHALALVERCLGLGCQWQITRWGPADGSVTAKLGDEPSVYIGHGQTPSLAILAALLRALISKSAA